MKPLPLLYQLAAMGNMEGMPNFGGFNPNKLIREPKELQDLDMSAEYVKVISKTSNLSSTNRAHVVATIQSWYEPKWDKKQKEFNPAPEDIPGTIRRLMDIGTRKIYRFRRRWTDEGVAVLIVGYHDLRNPGDTVELDSLNAKGLALLKTKEN